MIADATIAHATIAVDTLIRQGTIVTVDKSERRALPSGRRRLERSCAHRSSRRVVLGHSAQRGAVSGVSPFPPRLGDSELVVMIAFPLTGMGSAEAVAAEVRTIEAIDPRVRVVQERYLEPHSLRSARGPKDDDALRALAPVLTETQMAAFGQAEVILALDLPFDTPAHAPKLRWVQAIGAGTGQLQGAIAGSDVLLTNNAGSNSIGIAEFIFGRLLQHRKGFRHLDQAQKRHRWDGFAGREVEGSTLGLIGFGPINQAVAVRARAFGMKVLACRRTAQASPDVDAMFATAQLREMLSQSDFVIAAAPETPETIGLVDEAAFAAMRPGAFFGNVGRGSLVDETALIRALLSGHLGAAALDVVSQEPLPADHPLWDTPNLYLSPHCSTSAGAYLPKLQALFRENLGRYIAGEPLRGLVDLERGY